MFDVWSLDFHPKYQGLFRSHIYKFDKPPLRTASMITMQVTIHIYLIYLCVS